MSVVMSGIIALCIVIIPVMVGLMVVRLVNGKKERSIW